MRQFFRLSLLGVAALLAACAAPATTTTEQKPAAPPPVVERRLPELPVTQLEQEAPKVEPRKLYTLSVRDAEIREVLLTFGKKTDLNIVFGPDVKGTVTVDLKRVTLEEALDSLLTPIGLEYTRDGNFIRVVRPTLETRVFTLSYISTTRTGASTLSATAGGGGAVTGVTGAGTTAGGAGASSSVTSSDSVDFWGEVEKTLAGFVSTDGKAVVSKTAGIVAVTDYRRNLQRIARWLELLEGSAQRQVIIEAQIIEVTLTKEFQSGINWSLIPQNINLLLPALAKQGEVKILSTSKISTLNNQKAVIKVATDDIFFTTTKTREPTTGVETTTVTPQTITEGIVLDVTPQIAEDGSVIMNIRPSISERVGQATSPDGSTVPIISVRATDTVVRAQDGQAVTIGGVMQSKKTRDEDGRKTELVILLAPTVVIGRRASDLTQRELELLREVTGARAIRR